MPIEAFVRENWSHAPDFDEQEPEKAVYSAFTQQAVRVDVPGLGPDIWIHPRMYQWRERKEA